MSERIRVISPTDRVSKRRDVLVIHVDDRGDTPTLKPTIVTGCCGAHMSVGPWATECPMCGKAVNADACMERETQPEMAGLRTTITRYWS
jgi:hypothetical protein